MLPYWELLALPFHTYAMVALIMALLVVENVIVTGACPVGTWIGNGIGL